MGFVAVLGVCWYFDSGVDVRQVFSADLDGVGFWGIVFLGDFGLGGFMVFGSFRFDLCCYVLGLYGCVVGLAGVGCFCGLV